MSEFRTWEQLSRKEQLAATHYDFYKDVYGIRPRWMNYDELSESEIELELDRLGAAAEVQRKIESDAEAKAIEEFENAVNRLVEDGASRNRAIHWLLDAEGYDGDYEYGCFLLGLPYGYFKELGK